MKVPFLIHRIFLRWEPYVSFLITAGFFSWLGRHLKMFGQLGWAESIFIGVAFGFLVTASLALYRFFRPLAPPVVLTPPQGPQLQPSSSEGLDIRIWVGNMVPHFNFERDGCATLEIVFANVGRTPIRVARISGSITLAYSGFGPQKRVKLPTPAIQYDPTAEAAMAQGYYGRLVIAQPIPLDIQKLMPEMFTYRPFTYLEFGGLELLVAPADGGATKVVDLWDSVRLSAGEGEVRSIETFKPPKEKEGT